MSTGTILITGSEGLIGSSLRRRLQGEGYTVAGLDVRACNTKEHGDIRCPEQLEAAMGSCAGVVHLAAVSRVIWGEKYPALCSDINIGGLKSLFDIVSRNRNRPWVIFGSSREVYGKSPFLPAGGKTPLAPMNHYAKTKLAGENLTWEARCNGSQVAVLRFSNVYGSVRDYRDRVVPAFARAAAGGEPLHLEGADNVFDFTLLSDVVDGIVRTVHLMQCGETTLPPIDLVSGKGTTLRELANIAISATDKSSPVLYAPPRQFDVSEFYGDPGPAENILGWRARVGVSDGVPELVRQFNRKGCNNENYEGDSWLSDALQCRVGSL